ncbi:MAG: LysR family transcriptional regulator [Myxococcaceae bacterium]
MTHEVDLDHLTEWSLFALAVRHQSFAEAARRTGLTRSTVSQAIARLEQHLGEELLRRTTRRVAPTERGLQLYEAAARLLDDAASLGQEGPGIAQPLRVNAPSVLVMCGLGAVLARFATQSRGPLELAVENRPVDLLDSHDDVVVRVARQLPQGVVGRKLGADSLVCVAAPSYVARFGRPDAPQALLRHRCLRYRPTPLELEWRFATPKGERFSVPVQAPWLVDDGRVLLQLTLAGEGIAVMPGFLARDALAEGQLVRLLESWKLERPEVWALLPAGRRAPPRARQLVEFLARSSAEILGGPR